MTEHISEPWRYEIWNGLHHTVIDADGETVAFQVSTSEKAQRIVGCVNACEGINPKAIVQLLEALEVAQQFDLSPTFDAKATYTRRKAEEWQRIRTQISAAIAATKDGGS